MCKNELITLCVQVYSAEVRAVELRLRASGYGADSLIARSDNIHPTCNAMNSCEARANDVQTSNSTGWIDAVRRRGSALSLSLFPSSFLPFYCLSLSHSNGHVHIIFVLPTCSSKWQTCTHGEIRSYRVMTYTCVVKTAVIPSQTDFMPPGRNEHAFVEVLYISNMTYI